MSEVLRGVITLIGKGSFGLSLADFDKMLGVMLRSSGSGNFGYDSTVGIHSYRCFVAEKRFVFAFVTIRGIGIDFTFRTTLLVIVICWGIHFVGVNFGFNNCGINDGKPVGDQLFGASGHDHIVKQFGDFVFAQLQHEGDWDPDPSAVHKLLKHARDTSTLEDYTVLAKLREEEE